MRYFTNTQYFQDIANAIRQKKAEVEANSSTTKKGNTDSSSDPSLAANNEK